MRQKELIRAGYIAMMENLTREAEFEMARIVKGLDLAKGLDLSLEPSISESSKPLLAKSLGKLTQTIRDFASKLSA